MIFLVYLLAKLRHIARLKPWSLFSVLTEKYNWSPMEAAKFTSFLEPMLAYDPHNRATALDCLQHPWITNEPFDRYAENYLDGRTSFDKALSNQPVYYNQSFPNEPYIIDPEGNPVHHVYHGQYMDMADNAHFVPWHATVHNPNACGLSDLDGNVDLKNVSNIYIYIYM